MNIAIGYVRIPRNSAIRGNTDVLEASYGRAEIDSRPATYLQVSSEFPYRRNRPIIKAQVTRRH
jgi:hypothetical protein